MTQPDLTRLQDQIANVLRVGVTLSASAMILGLVLYFSSVSWAAAVLRAGLVLLMAIPVVRIVASFVDACRRRDWLLVWSTAFVLVVMAATLAYSMAGRA